MAFYKPEYDNSVINNKTMKKMPNKSLLNFTLTFLAVGLLIFFYGEPAYGQQTESDLKDRQITIKMDRQPLGRIFEKLINDYEIPIGFEQSEFDNVHEDYDFVINRRLSEEEISAFQSNNTSIPKVPNNPFRADKHPITINVENASLDNVLDIIIGQMENYKWKINDDVVNIFPILGRDKKIEILLNTNIKDFSLEKNKTFGFVFSKLVILPEVKSFQMEHKLILGSNITRVLDTRIRELPFEMKFSNLKLESLLNKIAKIKKGGWILKKTPSLKNNGKEYVEINI